MSTKLTRESNVVLALANIEKALNTLNLWSNGTNRPDESAFLSQTPFFLDTMSFEQWLEFVLIPRFYQIIRNQDKLPQKVVIHTYAMEIYRGKWQEYKELISSLTEFDKLFEN